MPGSSKISCAINLKLDPGNGRMLGDSAYEENGIEMVKRFKITDSIEDITQALRGICDKDP